jgi:hypothetical protein
VKPSAGLTSTRGIAAHAAGQQPVVGGVQLEQAQLVLVAQQLVRQRGRPRVLAQFDPSPLKARTWST